MSVVIFSPLSRMLCFHLCPFVGLSAGFNKNYEMDFNENLMEGASRPRIDPINFLVLIKGTDPGFLS